MFASVVVVVDAAVVDGGAVVVAAPVVVGCLTERARESGSPGPFCHLSSTPSSSASTQSVLVMESSGRSIHMPYPVLAASVVEVVGKRLEVGDAVVFDNGTVDVVVSLGIEVSINEPAVAGVVNGA